MRRKSRKAGKKQRKGIGFFLLRYTIGVIIISLCIILALRFIPHKNTIPCANTISCTQSLHFKVENNVAGVFDNQKVIPPPITIAPFNPNVLGTTTSATNSAGKHIYVDLTKQMLFAYDDKTLFMETPISSGKWHPTPPGDYTIWEKIRSTRMTGGSGDDYYDLPNVPYVMFFYNDDVPEGAGYSLHGAYWHDNFGHPMSHGCINMRQVDAEKLYDWATPITTGTTTLADATNTGTKVTIYGEAP